MFDAMLDEWGPRRIREVMQEKLRGGSFVVEAQTIALEKRGKQLRFRTLQKFDTVLDVRDQRKRERAAV